MKVATILVLKCRIQLLKKKCFLHFQSALHCCLNTFAPYALIFLKKIFRLIDKQVAVQKKISLRYHSFEI